MTSPPSTWFLALLDGIRPPPKRSNMTSSSSPTGMVGTADGKVAIIAPANTTTNLRDLLDDPILCTITSYLPNGDRIQVALMSTRNNPTIPRDTTTTTTTRRRRRRTTTTTTTGSQSTNVTEPPQLHYPIDSTALLECLN